MRVFVAATDGGRLVVERRPRPCAHGAELVSLPERTGEAERSIVERVGDVEAGPWSLVREAADAEDPRLEDTAALLAAFESGTLDAAPELLFALRQTEPAADWEVAPGVRMAPFRTPTLLPATHTNSFLLTDGERPSVLVEPAPTDPAEIDRLARWAAGVDRIFVTHHHPDHVGGLAALAERLDAPVLAHPSTASRLRGARFEHVEDGETLAVGERRWRAMHTPGHAPGHLCLIDTESGTGIVGDVVAGVGTILVEPGEGDMGEYLESLERLAELELRKVLPAHGGLLVGGEVFRRYALHRRMREEKVFAALQQAPGPVGGLVPIAYDDAPKAVWPLARLSVEAHLLHLEAQGRAERTATGWVAVG